MKLNLKNKSLRTLAITSLLAPVLTGMSITANAEASTTLADNAAVTATSSEAKTHLMAKLKQLAYFSADFSQKILNENGDVLQQGAGNLAISKPNLVNWQTTSPDETLIISDGSTLWFYDPFIEQASAYSLSQSISNTPILLLTSDDPLLWQQYTVIELKETAEVESVNTGSRFEVLPKAQNSQIKKLTLAFVETSAGKVSELSEFSFLDATGQTSQITLSNFASQTKPSSGLFNFTLPEGVRLEDKR